MIDRQGGQTCRGKGLTADEAFALASAAESRVDIEISLFGH